MSMTRRVYFSGRVPAASYVQQALRTLGFPLTITDLSRPLDAYGGFMPMTLDDGEETGVEVHVRTLDPDQGGQGSRGIDETFDSLMSLRWGGTLDEGLAAFALSAAVATVAKGAIFDDQAGTPVSVEQTIQEARELSRGLAPGQAKRKPAQRPHVRELLREFPEFGFASRMFYLRPVQDVLVGYLIERPPSGPRLWGVRMPLYELSELVHLSYSRVLAHFLPNGEPWHRIDPPKDVREAVLRLEADRKRWTANDERAFAERLAPIISDHRPALLEMQSLEGFAAELAERGADTAANGLRAKTYGLTCLMLGDAATARRVLSAVSQDHLRTPERVRDLEETLRTLELGLAEAKAYRARVVEEMRRRFLTGAWR